MAVAALKAESVPKPAALRAVVIAGGKRPLPIPEGVVRIPASIVDLDSFRRWVSSDDYPERGRFDYLDDELWVDLTMEDLFTHNQVKGEFGIVLGGVVKAAQIGWYFPDGARVSNPAANLSSEPDGVFASADAVQADRVRFIETAEGSAIELEGSPDMVLEVVSDSSVAKDTVRLRQLYWRAGVLEYWLVDARPDPLRFDLLRRGRRGFVATRSRGGWLYSAVFGRSFRLTRQAGVLGRPQYTLAIQTP
jgi:Uma2 family endonuclease